MKKTLTFLFSFISLTLLTAQYHTNGTATQLNESCIRVTEAVNVQGGSAFFTTPLDLSEPFSFSGTMFFGDNDGGADGMTFLLTNDTLAQGMTGGGIGYQGIVPSLVVEFDTWQNVDFGDPVQDHLGILSNGIANHNLAESLVPVVILPNIENNEEHCFTITWDPAVPLFQATLADNTITYNGDISAFFPAGVPVYYGYTGSTGGAFNEQRVCLYNTAELENLQISGATDVCQNDGVQTLTANLEGGTWGLLADENGQYDPAGLEPGTYSANYVLGDLECEYSDIFFINIHPQIQVELVQQTNIDCNQETGSLEVTGLNGAEPYAYAWSNGSSANAIDNLSAGTYTVTISDLNGCTETAAFEITAGDAPQITNSAIIPQSCNAENEIVGATLSVELSGGTQPYSYSIDGGLSSQEENTFSNITAENLTLTVLDAAGCQITQDFNFGAAVYPSVEITASSLEFCSENINLSVLSQDSESILWSTEETSETISVNAAGDYSVDLLNEFNCVTTASITLSECLDYSIPNVFTPNNDAVNETFGLVTESENITYSMQIFSRWGELVYEGTESWDGTVDGKPFPADVLSYIIEVNIRGEVIVEKGDVTLIR